MVLPKQTPPIKRPHFTQPALAVDVDHGSAANLVAIRMDLLHGANYNDPAAFIPPSYPLVVPSSSRRWGGMGRFS